MSHLGQHPESGLQIYGSDTYVAWNADEMDSSAQSGAERFLRRVCLGVEVKGIGSLTEALEVADMAITDAAKHMGVTPVDHEWALYERPETLFRRDGADERDYNNPLLPEGLVLIADVASVTSLEPLNGAEYRAVTREVARYYGTSKRPVLADLYAGQCVKGLTVDSDEVKLFLLDIEPRIVMP